MDHWGETPITRSDFQRPSCGGLPWQSAREQAMWASSTQAVALETVASKSLASLQHRPS
jgi:hypothetical protein